MKILHHPELWSPAGLSVWDTVKQQGTRQRTLGSVRSQEASPFPESTCLYSSDSSKTFVELKYKAQFRELSGRADTSPQKGERMVS